MGIGHDEGRSRADTALAGMGLALLDLIQIGGSGQQPPDQFAIHAGTGCDPHQLGRIADIAPLLPIGAQQAGHDPALRPVQPGPMHQPMGIGRVRLARRGVQVQPHGGGAFGHLTRGGFGTLAQLGVQMLDPVHALARQ